MMLLPLYAYITYHVCISRSLRVLDFPHFPFGYSRTRVPALLRFRSTIFSAFAFTAALLWREPLLFEFR